MPFQRILVRATNWVGDAVMSVPALQALREQFPAAHIAILARPWVAGLYGREPFCDELIPYNAPRGWSGFLEKLALAARLREGRFDCAILLQNAFEAAALTKIAGIPVRIGYSRDGRGWLLTHPIPVPSKQETPTHQRFYYLELLKRAKVIEDYSTTDGILLSGAQKLREEGQRRFRDAGIDGSVVGVSPGAAYGGAKRWLPERFAEAAIEVARQHGAAVAVFGSADEVSICDQVREGVGAAGVRVLNFGGGTSLPEFIELAAACTVFLTNDSGPMHIASALGIPTVAIFGATDDEATGPTGEHSSVVRGRVKCSPCLLRECPIDHVCMTSVTAERVAQTANTLIAIESKI